MRRRTPVSVPAIMTRVNNKRQSLLAVGTVSADATVHEQLTFARKLVNGVLTVRDGALTGKRAGRPLLGPGVVARQSES